MESEESAEADENVEGGGEESTDTGTMDTDFLDELPDGSGGWSYMESGDGEGEESEVREQRSKRGYEGEEEKTGTQARDGKPKDGNSSSGDDVDAGSGTSETKVTEILEEAAASDVSEHEISDILAESGLSLSKGMVTAFVSGSETKITEGGFEEGGIWKEGIDAEDSDFVELGWIDTDGTLTAQGASVLGYAHDIISGADGTDAALVGYLNSKGVDVFFEEAIRRGPDEPDDEGGFFSRLLGD